MSTTPKRAALSVLALGAATALVLTGCSAKADPGAAAADGDTTEVATGAGIENGTITLGALADMTGPFAALSTELHSALQLYWDGVNAEGGVCGTFPVELEILDTGYNVQNAVNLYNQSSSDVLAYQQVIGASMTLAIIEQAREESIVTIPRGGVHALLENEAAFVTAATYSGETANVLDYAVAEGIVEEGASIGVIYAEGDYGVTALEGYRHVADAFGITIVEQKVQATDTDMSAQVSAFEAAGVDAIALAATPTATASVASVLASRGLELPILGASPTFAQSLLGTVAGDYLREHMTISSPSTSFDMPEGQAIYDAVVAADPDAQPTLQSAIGWGDAAAMHQLLEAACAAGDLTREGVMAAKATLVDVDTDGAYPAMRYDTPGEASTAEVFIMRPADVPGGLEMLEGPYQGPNVTTAV